MESELRFDPLRREWVVLSRSRARRPNEFRSVRYGGGSGGACPFCTGNEGETPPEVSAERPKEGEGSVPNGPGWSLRVVPNRFPAVERADVGEPTAMGRAQPGNGIHEVIIETAEHDLHPADYDPDRRLKLLRAYRDRIGALSKEPGIRYVVVFRNAGPRSGASLAHPHTQVIALEQLSPTMEIEQAAVAAHRQKAGRCLLCDLVAEELAANRRVLRQEGGFVAYLPYAGRFPAEAVLTSDSHPVPFESLEDGQLETLGELLCDVVGRMRRRFREPSFNWILHTVAGGGDAPGHHWRFDILPRLGQLGGFELGTGMYINGLPPEDAVELLRISGPRAT